MFLYIANWDVLKVCNIMYVVDQQKHVFDMPVCVYNLHTVYVCSASITSMPFLCSRLILIADKDKVYDKFPIPLINRLEKHLVTTSTILLPDQQVALRTLQNWIHGFTKVLGYVCMHIMCLLHVYDTHYLVLHSTTLYSIHRFKKGDAFIGFQSQTPATVVLQASQSPSAAQDSWHVDVSV